MAFDVEFTDEFELWWDQLNAAEQQSVSYSVLLLQERGPALGRPHADTLYGSRFSNMKELRVQHAGRTFRILFAFDPRRTALLLLGGDKTGDVRFYEQAIAKADALYDNHLRKLDE